MQIRYYTYIEYAAVISIRIQFTPNFIIGESYMVLKYIEISVYGCVCVQANIIIDKMTQ